MSIMTITSNTFVSAFLTNINGNKKTFDDYIEFGEKLLSLENIYKVIFIEKYIYDKYYSTIEYSHPNNHFVFIEKKDNYLYEHYDKITEYSLITDNVEKDTIDYMFFQCHKTEWVKQAIDINPFNTEQFLWIDFSIYHIIRNDDLFKEYMTNISNYTNPTNHVKIGGCWDINNTVYWHNRDFYKRIFWYFAGGLFGGNKEKMVLFSNLMRDKCIQIINEQKSIMWEVNIWYLIYWDNKDLFTSYYCGHDTYMLLNYYNEPCYYTPNLSNLSNLSNL